MENYNVCWTEQSKNSGESMPLSGFDTGCNIWVENNELFMYLAQSGGFDQTGLMLKAGRIRFTFDRDIFANNFSQQLRLATGDMVIKTDSAEINFWADTARSTVHIGISAKEPVRIRCAYEIWRTEDVVEPMNGSILFYHRNIGAGTLDKRLCEQGIEYLREYFPDVERNRTTGGLVVADGMVYIGSSTGKYMNHNFKSYILETPTDVNSINVNVYLNTAQTETIDEWKNMLSKNVASSVNDKNARDNTVLWWKQYWERSHVYIKPDCRDNSDLDWQVGKNYQLFRYLLAANAYGEFPTKFNGGLFTVDAQSFVEQNTGSPDSRDWGGIMFTAQNQRLVYWGMIKNGDFDMMKPEFEFYRRLVEPLKKRTEHFFGLKDCACYCEQIDANGLSSYYGKYGVDYPLQVRHHYVEALEFAFMIMKYHETSGEDIGDYIPFIMSVLNFYDYRYCHLDNGGKRIIYPSTALETYHAAPNTEIYGEAGVEAANYNDEQTAVTNPADVIAALSDAIKAIVKTDYLNSKEKERLLRLSNELPDIPMEFKHDHLVIAPCEFPKKYFKGNCEIPQLNTVYPYNTYGINKPNLAIARNTYYYAWDDEDQLQHISWHTNGAYAARIGLTDEAVKYMRLKLCDSGRKFSAYWGPGHDYTPDHNWGGSGMIGVQEMLMQNFDGKIYILPAWDLKTDVDFKLWADNKTTVEVKYKNGKLEYKITPPEREKDIVLPEGLSCKVVR